MDFNGYEEWIDRGLKITPVLILIIFWKRIMRSFSWITDGISKKEFAALCFLGLLIYMFWVDGHREHEWSYFSDIQYFVTFAFIAVGLGLNEIIEAIYAFKGKQRNKEDKPEN